MREPTIPACMLRVLARFIKAQSEFDGCVCALLDAYDELLSGMQCDLAAILERQLVGSTLLNLQRLCKHVEAAHCPIHCKQKEGR